MAGGSLTYALITPVRNEDGNLGRLGRSIACQTVAPSAWVIVDTGSTDSTVMLAEELASTVPFVRATAISGTAFPTRGGPIVRGFVAGIEQLEQVPDIVIKLDADLSFDHDYCERLLDAFARDPYLGLASGICTELRDGEWQQLFGTRFHVWGACRAYRWECLQDVMPLEERQGWDEIDSIKAQLRGWRARTLGDVPFRHHRPEGIRERSSRARWSGQGETAHYMGYRFSYLVLRALWRARHDGAALAMVTGYMAAAITREPQCPDGGVRAHLRAAQSVRQLRLRLSEALGRVV